MKNKILVELKDTISHVGAALKTHLLSSVKNTWNTVYQMAMFSRGTSNHSKELVPKNKVSIFIFQ